MAGILVSIQLATESDSDGKSQTTNTAVPAPAASGGANPAPATGPTASQAASGPAKVLAGPMKITLKPGADSIDLDSPSPVPQPGEKGADATVGFNLPDLTLGPLHSGNVVAIAPPQGPGPTRDECNQAIAKRGTYTSGELAQDMRVCLQTEEGHTAYLRITSVPTRTALTFEATVWE
ncbi:hypothetical protein [Embleya sp. NBC_00896]|uniref:hypothetical protein n=1 Tax=Embleya sp. NBC_00896 TaxID=2975961 RepID=UPI00386BFCFA|nr:hypothetical protein OG928_06130 [Embleya sp. NBC_00896]